MSQLDGLLSGIVSDPREETRWLVLADWLQEHDRPDRAELLRLHRRLLATCLEPDAHPGRAGWHARVVELLVAGVKPCVPQETITLPGGMTMTLTFVPPGAFLMGSKSGGPKEQPVCRVEVPHPFFLGVHPVTQAQWQAIRPTNPSQHRGPNRPVDSVTWGECQRFCAAVSEATGRRVQLPSDWEWEYACRSGTTTEYFFGDALRSDLANFNGTIRWSDSPLGEHRKETLPVGSLPPNGWGLFDMHGSLWEWCAEWLSESLSRYAARKPGPSRSTGYRVYRGGCYDSNAGECRSAYRGGCPARDRNNYSGFRVCLRLN